MLSPAAAHRLNPQMPVGCRLQQPSASVVSWQLPKSVCAAISAGCKGVVVVVFVSGYVDISSLQLRVSHFLGTVNLPV